MMRENTDRPDILMLLNDRHLVRLALYFCKCICLDIGHWLTKTKVS
jgi:hypothetical protein